MANPTTAWDRIPVWGVWLRVDDTPVNGTVTFTLSQRVTRTDGRVIFPEGAKITRTIGDLSQQDATIRNAVRDAWKAADSSLPGYDSTAWDTWWTTVMVPAGVWLSFPAVDDPDIVSNPAEPWSVLVSESLEGGSGKSYSITPLLSQLDLAIPGINLGTIEVPPGSPSVPAPMYAKGIPGGVASLGEDGKVPSAQLPAGGGGGASQLGDLTDVDTSGAVSGEVLGFNGTGWEPVAATSALDDLTDVSTSGATNGQALIYNSGTNTWGPGSVASSWSALTDKPTYIGAGASQSAARDAIGAGTSNLALGTTAGTAAEGNDIRITGAAQKSANLSDLTNTSTARSNLGLGGAATLNVGTGAGTVKAGDWTPGLANLPAAVPVDVWQESGGGWPSRPAVTSGARVNWIGYPGNTDAPGAMVSGTDSYMMRTA